MAITPFLVPQLTDKAVHVESSTKLKILDLHGDSRKGESSPDGSVDENVRTSKVFVLHLPLLPCQILGHRFWKKPTCMDLKNASMSNFAYLRPFEKFNDISPEAPTFSFNDKQNDVPFADGNPITEIFLNRNTGIQTKNDILFTDISKLDLRKRMKDVLENVAKNNDITCKKYGLKDSSGWRVSKLYDIEFDGSAVHPFLYKPFDHRFIYYNTKVLGRAPIRLCSTTKTKYSSRSDSPSHRLLGHACLRWPIEEKTGSHDRTTQLFPLYVYPKKGHLDISDDNRLGTTSISSSFISKLHDVLGVITNCSKDCPDDMPVIVEDVFYYIYSVLHSPNYRELYGHELMADFPRIPLTFSLKLFKGLAKLGAELVTLHLMESPKVKNPSNKFVGPDDLVGASDPTVEKVSYSDETVWLNKNQTTGFEGVPEEVWNFHIGGYQVCHKWLKDRQAKGGKNPRPGRVLTKEDRDHYQGIIVALSETIRLMAEIDKVIDHHGGWPDAFQPKDSNE